MKEENDPIYEELTLNPNMFCGVEGDTRGLKSYAGVTCGRVAGRIGDAKFVIKGETDETYKLAANCGPSCIMGGVKGFDVFPWHPTVYMD